MIVMPYLFIFFYIVCCQLTHMIAYNEGEGYIEPSIWSGVGVWSNMIIIAIACIWYCGWIWGIILIAFSFVGLLHATIGWLISLVPVLIQRSRMVGFNKEFALFAVAKRERILFIPVYIASAVFVYLSFSLSYFKSALDLFPTIYHVLILAVVLVIGFIARKFIAKPLLNKVVPGE